jgi:hypothetical protein
MQVSLPVFAGEFAFRVRVIDENNQPVSNATVNLDILPNLLMPTAKKLHELTDTNGMWAYQGSYGGGVDWGVDKAGYYQTGGDKLVFTNMPVQGRFEPWNKLYEIQLRLKNNPIPMYARHTGMENPPLKIPEFGKPIGFDLIKSDWVAPYGKGETPDFIFCVATTNSAIPDSYYKEVPRAPQWKDMTASLVFANDGDGLLCVIDVLRSRGSIFRLPRYAPESGYESNLLRSCRGIWTNGTINLVGDQWNENQNYIFRVRSQRDQNGAITNALYGKIRGPIEFHPGGDVIFTYYLNPTPNDRNLEYDASHNLLKAVLGYREAPPRGP